MRCEEFEWSNNFLLVEFEGVANWCLPLQSEWMGRMRAAYWFVFGRTVGRSVGRLVGWLVGWWVVAAGLLANQKLREAGG